MKITRLKVVILITFVIFISCEKQKSVEGLWLVEKVQMGDQEMTPVSRWMKFNNDGTQTSGNGWLQHSYGTWTLQDDLLSVEDKNGIKDSDTPFSITIEKEQMTWKRLEGGQEVIVSLKRIEKLPQSEGNKLIGLWKLSRALDQGNDITAMINPEEKSMLHLRWDNTYVQHNMPKGKQYGVYKIHGHKSEIQMVNYGSESSFSFWSFSLQESKLILTSTDQKSTMEFERINSFLGSDSN